MKELLCNDKFMVIVAVLIICLFAMSTFPDGSAENIVTASISGLFGIAVGRSLKNDSEQ